MADDAVSAAFAAEAPYAAQAVLVPYDDTSSVSSLASSAPSTAPPPLLRLDDREAAAVRARQRPRPAGTMASEPMHRRVRDSMPTLLLRTHSTAASPARRTRRLGDSATAQHARPSAEQLYGWVDRCKWLGERREATADAWAVEQNAVADGFFASKTLHRWHVAAHKRRVCRRVVGNALFAAYWRQWRCVVSDAVLQRVLRRWLVDTLLGGGFFLWKQKAGMVRHGALVNRIFSRWRNRELAAGWAPLKALFDAGREADGEKREWLRAFVQKMLANSELGGALAQWRERDRRVQSDALLGRVVRRLANAKLWGAFRSVRLNAQWERASAFMRRAVLRRTWRGWMAYRAVLKLVKRWHNVELWKGFSALRAWAFRALPRPRVGMCKCVYDLARLGRCSIECTRASHTKIRVELLRASVDAANRTAERMRTGGAAAARQRVGRRAAQRATARALEASAAPGVLRGAPAPERPATTSARRDLALSARLATTASTAAWLLSADASAEVATLRDAASLARQKRRRGGRPRSGRAADPRLARHSISRW